MNDVQPFGLLVLLISLTGLLAVLSTRLSERVQIPTPMFFLGAAAVAGEVFPHLHHIDHITVERLVTVALVVILLDGGLHVGWRRIRPALGAITVVGILGTFLTAAAVAVLAHATLGLSWYVALLVGTAVAPTDPAVVFSVLGRREITGRSGTILEGESGANDPVGIALMAGLLSAGGLSIGSFGEVVLMFMLQMVVGGAIGLAGGWIIQWFLRKVSLPGAGLYSIGTLFAAGVIFSVASLAHGSGFMAVFVAGILLGDIRAPYKREIERFQSALASLGEIVAFVVLGLTVDLKELSHPAVWAAGLLIGVVLAFVIRPLFVGLCLIRVTLSRGERGFVLWAGLKGAVPILLGLFLLEADVPDPHRLYGIVVVVVTFSVLVQGSTVPLVATLLRVPMHITEPEPWTLGVRLRDEPQGVHRHTVTAGSAADGSAIRDLGAMHEYVWISFVIRDGELLAVTADTRLQAGDDVMILAESDLRDSLRDTFTRVGTG